MLNEIFFSECLNCNTKINYKELFCYSCLSLFEPTIYRCSNCGYPLELEAKFCKNCITDNYYDYIYVSYWYNGIMRKFLKYVKFHYGIKYGHIFNFLLKRILFTHNYDLITPVPAHFIRNFRRFVQPAYIIAKILAKNNNMKYEQVLKRVKKTDYQWKFKKKERGKNIKGAFCLDSDVKGLKILLVDDIITTGSTINECSKVLKENGSKKVDVFCLAKGKFI